MDREPQLMMVFECLLKVLTEFSFPFCLQRMKVLDRPITEREETQSLCSHRLPRGSARSARSLQHPATRGPRWSRRRSMGPCPTWPSPLSPTAGLCLLWTPGMATWSLTIVSRPQSVALAAGATAGCVCVHVRLKSYLSCTILCKCLIYCLLYFLTSPTSCSFFLGKPFLSISKQLGPRGLGGGCQEGVRLWLIHTDLSWELKPGFLHPSRPCWSKIGRGGGVIKVGGISRCL